MHDRWGHAWYAEEERDLPQTSHLTVATSVSILALFIGALPCPSTSFVISTSESDIRRCKYGEVLARFCVTVIPGAAKVIRRIEACRVLVLGQYSLGSQGQISLEPMVS